MMGKLLVIAVGMLGFIAGYQAMERWGSGLPHLFGADVVPPGLSNVVAVEAGADETAAGESLATRSRNERKPNSAKPR